ncbi:MAG: membrane-bound lytic murein transglycosylase MltF, partial [Steroidobacteraceae bacterium]|nr:membrane-bound lytic murein transglycosylase MltF [Steroidobacteraceae bacterium]
MWAARSIPFAPGFAILAVVAWLTGCRPAPPIGVEELRARGVLRAATLYGPTSYYLGPGGPEGVDYELLRAYAQSIGVRLDVTVYPDIPALRAALRDGKADLAAAQLSFDASWGRDGVPARPHYQMPQVWVARRGGPRPRRHADLGGLKVLVRAGSPQWQRARQIQRDVPTLQILTLSQGPAQSLYDQLLNEVADVALVDADEFSIARATRRRLLTAFADPQPRPVQWIAAPQAARLTVSIDQFFATSNGASLLASIMQRAAPAARRVARVMAREFLLLQQTRLPYLLPYFLEAAEQTGLDWRLLAALGYQESQWDPTAISPNGALGLMMLMPQTARALGVEDPFDARANILAGARYLLEERERLPRRIAEPDRTSLALASYNMGRAHLEDARVITQKNGGNPDRWEDVRRFLPLLEETYWYSQVPNGYARGSETVNLVDRVRQF